MLILGAKENARIRLTVPPSDKPTEIVVVNAWDVKTRFGFDAPREVVILREGVEPCQER